MNWKKWKKSQNCDISPTCGGTIFQPISTKIGGFVDLTEVVTPAKVVLKYKMVFPG